MDYDKIIKNLETAKELEEKLGLVYLELAATAKTEKPYTSTLFFYLYNEGERRIADLEKLRGNVFLEKYNYEHPQDNIGDKDN